MIHKIYSLQQAKKYGIAFKAITVLNLILVVFLLNNILGQTSDGIPQNQSALVVRVVPQNNSPLQISIVGVDNSARSFQTIIYRVHNVANKSIRAYTVLGGQVITTSFTLKLLRPGEIDEGSIAIERQNIRQGKEIFLSIDYVEFEDGSSWGSDSQGKSRHIAGERAGRIAAIRQLKEIIRGGNLPGLTNILSQEITSLTVPKPNANLGEEWSKGFQRGYKSVVFTLKRVQTQDLSVLFRKLDELEELAR